MKTAKGSFVNIALFASFVLLVPARATADDYGPHPDLRAIRSAVPLLLATRVHALHADPRAVVVRDTVVVGNDAVATWSVGSNLGLVVLHRHNDLWWLGAEANYDDVDKRWAFDKPGALLGCPVGGLAFSIAPTSANLTKRLGASHAVAAAAAVHNEFVAKANANLAAWLADPKNAKYAKPGVSGPAFVPECQSTHSGPDALVEVFAAGYRMTFSPQLAALLTNGRAPTAGEMPPSRGADAFFFFSGQAKTASVCVAQGTTLNVWFPFVLDPSLRYTLTIAGSDPIIGPLEATLADNMLHFTLPAFTAPAGVELMGEIDGLPPVQR